MNTEKENMNMFSELSLMRILNLQEKEGSLYICQGKMIGVLNPSNIPDYKIMVIDVKNGKETRLLIKDIIYETLKPYLNDIVLIQCIGVYDFDLDLVIAYDVIVLTVKEEIVFSEQ